jgi:hypothetical protein
MDIAIVIVIIVLFAMIKFWPKDEALSDEMQKQKTILLNKIYSCQYYNDYKKSSIGVDTINEKLILIKNNKFKEYDFSEVRKWRTNISSGGHITGGRPMQNYGIERENIAESGLFIEVKDIENPVWQIMFAHDKNLKMELAKWMEILTQHINENKGSSVNDKFIGIMTKWEYDNISSQSEEIQKEWNSLSDEHRSEIMDKVVSINFNIHGNKMEEYFKRLEAIPEIERTSDIKKQINKDVAALNLKENPY